MKTQPIKLSRTAIIFTIPTRSEKNHHPSIAVKAGELKTSTVETAAPFKPTETIHIALKEERIKPYKTINFRFLPARRKFFRLKIRNTVTKAANTNASRQKASTSGGSRYVSVKKRMSIAVIDHTAVAVRHIRYPLESFEVDFVPEERSLNYWLRIKIWFLTFMV